MSASAYKVQAYTEESLVIEKMSKLQCCHCPRRGHCEFRLKCIKNIPIFYDEIVCPDSFTHINYVCDIIGLKSNVRDFLLENRKTSGGVSYHSSCLHWIEIYIGEKFKTIDHNWTISTQFEYLGFNLFTAREICGAEVGIVFDMS